MLGAESAPELTNLLGQTEKENCWKCLKDLAVLRQTAHDKAIWKYAEIVHEAKKHNMLRNRQSCLTSVRHLAAREPELASTGLIL